MPIKVVSYVPISAELRADAVDVVPILERAMDRYVRPWNHPDPSPFPALDLFPRSTRLIATLRDWRDRLAYAADVVRHGVPEHEDEW